MSTTWTQVRPTEYGYYWCRFPRGDGAFKQPGLVRVVKHIGTKKLAALFPGGLRELARCDAGIEWSDTPIALPKEAA